jgi:uncharacterized hydrophobic protein (TIGR00271 family)
MRFAATNDLAHLRRSVFFEGPDAGQKLSRFWILLVLAAIIAAAGVVGDSTATVIGAMIVAPLMTPILGTMLAIVLADRDNLVRSLVLVIGGALTAVAIGYLIGIVAINPIVAEVNSQVAGRVTPRLIDLLAALATGVVGSIALVRSDISDTLPGVAIAISLVPPLSVVGLTMESGAYDQSLGALLLFLTNVTAILASGTIVMVLFGVYRMAAPVPGSETRTINRRRAIILIGTMAAIIIVPLTTSTVTIANQTLEERKAREAAEEFGDTVGWDVTDVSTLQDLTVIKIEGPLPLPDADALRAELESHGVDPSRVRVVLIPISVIEYE